MRAKEEEIVGTTLLFVLALLGTTGQAKTAFLNHPGSLVIPIHGMARGDCEATFFHPNDRARAEMMKNLKNEVGDRECGGAYPGSVCGNCARNAASHIIPGSLQTTCQINAYDYRNSTATSRARFSLLCERR